MTLAGLCAARFTLSDRAQQLTLIRKAPQLYLLFICCSFAPGAPHPRAFHFRDVGHPGTKNLLPLDAQYPSPYFVENPSICIVPPARKR
jgi:hypothetical protein